MLEHYFYLVLMVMLMKIALIPCFKKVSYWPPAHWAIDNFPKTIGTQTNMSTRYNCPGHWKSLAC